MKNFTTLALWVTVMFAGTACNKNFVPNTANVPLLQEKGEIRANLNPRNLQLAYAPIKGLGIMANGHFLQKSFEIDQTEDPFSQNNKTETEHKQQFGEFGVGYFKPFGNIFSFEVFSGWGTGKVNSHITPHPKDNSAPVTRSYSANYSRVFVQPAVGLSTKAVDFGIFVRYGSTGFRNINTQNYTSSQLDSEDLDSLSIKRPDTFEPGIVLRTGYKFVKLETQVRVLVPEIRTIYIPRVLVSFALHFNLANRFKDEKLTLVPAS